MIISKTSAILLIMTVPILCFFISGCNDSDGEVNVNKPEKLSLSPPTSELTGTWAGTISGYGETITATMIITQNGDSISGTYILNHNGDTDEGTVSGTLSGGTGTLTFVSSGGTNAHGNFVFGDTTAVGSFTYGSLTLSITLNRS